MFICTELIEETGDPQGYFLHVGIFLAWLRKVRVLEIFHTFDGVMTYCHFFESVKNHINADISRPIRNRNVKT